MLPFSPNPRNKLYTDLYSYSQFFKYFLTKNSQKGGKDIENFEKALRDRFNTRFALCVYQCRVGIYLALKALIKPGQEVILSPYTIADVVNMVIFAGGHPIFADVDRETCNISASEVEQLISPHTGAVLITHLHGLAAEAHRIREICDHYNVPMVEDCAQSFGVQEQGKLVGTIGDVGVFSFEMHKNLPTWRGGAVITNRKDVVEKILAEIKDYSHPPLPGILSKVKAGLKHNIASTPILFQTLVYPLLRLSYLRNIEFINNSTLRKPQESKPALELPDEYKSWYTPFQARIGISQLKKVEKDIKTRIEYGQLYHEGLKDIEGLTLPSSRIDGSMTYLWFPLQYSQRDKLLKFMFENGRDIAAGHFTNSADAPRFKDYYRDCPNARKIEKDLLYLPTYPSYSPREVEENIKVIQKFFKLRNTALQIQKIEVTTS